MDTEDDCAKFLSEARTMVTLQYGYVGCDFPSRHSHICGLTGISFDHNNSSFLVTQLIDCGSLESYLKRYVSGLEVLDDAKKG